MADLEDVRRIALELPEALEEPARRRFAVRGKPICWTWHERTAPGAARQPRDDVLAIRVAGELEKDGLLALDAEVFFTEPHYDGYPAILVRLSAIDLVLLRRLLTDAWQVQAPRGLVREMERREMERGAGRR